MASELMNITEEKSFPFGAIKLKQVNKRTSEPRLGFKPLAFFHNWNMLYLIGLHMLAFTTKNKQLFSSQAEKNRVQRGFILRIEGMRF